MTSKFPSVSIILPTYNRAKFLPEAFEAIRAQQWTDWELIVVDDGSTDGTRELVAELTRGWQQPVRYIYQENQGAYGARNTGLDQATSKYIAFFDSDDLWLPHHLQDCVEPLEAHSDLDWVWGACRMVNLTTGAELAPSTFYVDGQPRPFTKLRGQWRGKLCVIDDATAACCQINHGLYCGLQNSVIRRRLFDAYRFDAELRNEAEDQVIVIWALLHEYRFAFIDQVNVVYRVHDANSSFSAVSTTVEKRRRLQEALLAGFERLYRIAPLGKRERVALAQRMGAECFWQLGYVTEWMNGNRQRALISFRRGLKYWPWDWRCWKTYGLAYLRSAPRKVVN